MRPLPTTFVAAVLGILWVPGAWASNVTNGLPLDIRVDAKGCVQAPVGVGAVDRDRAVRLTGDAIFEAATARNGCTPDDRTWRIGPVVVGRNAAVGPLTTVRVQVRRRETVQADEWLVTGITDVAIRVQSPRDQCSPSSYWRLVETEDEVRVRYGRVPGEGACTLVGFTHWDDERALRLSRPLGGRTLVLERAQVRRDYLERSCPWFRSAIAASIGASTAAERTRIARSQSQVGYESDEFTWSRFLALGLESRDPALRARVARGVRRDMRLQAFPDGCERPLDLPAVTSDERTELVAAGYFRDARLVGLDGQRRVTWAIATGSIVESVSICPDGNDAMVAERVEGRTWDRVLVRTSFVDLDTGEVNHRTGIRRLHGDDLIGLTATCTSGAARTGWLASDRIVPIGGDSLYGKRETVVDRVEGVRSVRVLATPLFGSSVTDGRMLVSDMEYADAGERMRFGWLELASGQLTLGPWMPPGPVSFSPGGSRMLVDRGDMDVYDITGSRFTLLRTIPDQRPVTGDDQIARDSVIWVDERHVRKHEGRDDRGRMFDIDIETGDVAATGLWPRGDMVPMLEHRGDLLSWESWFIGKFEGLRRLDVATNQWVKATTLSGSFTLVVVR